MKNGARLFAYTTWVLMISLAVIVFTSNFLIYVTDPDWIGLIALLAFGFIYLNFTFLAVKRYIRKTLQETFIHYLLAFLIFLPPVVWAIFISEEIEGARVIFTLVIAFSCGLGAYYGHRSGKRQQKLYLEKLENT